MKSQDIFENTQVIISPSQTLKLPKIKFQKHEMVTSSSQIFKSNSRILRNQLSPIKFQQALSKINKNDSPNFKSYTTRTRDQNIFQKLYTTKSPQNQTPRLNQIITNINTEVQQEIEQLQNVTPRAQQKKISALESSQNTEVIINSLNFSIAIQRQSFNDLRSKRKEQKEKLKLLQVKLQNIESTEELSVDLQVSESDVLAKISEIKELIEFQDLERQQLEYMKSQKKKEIICKTKPLLILKVQVKEIYFQIQEQEKETNINIQGLKNLKRQ